jgi:hypothetical protein
MGGGAVASPDDACLLADLSKLAGAYEAVAETKTEQTYWKGRKVELFEEAVDILKIRTNPVKRFFAAIPLLGRIF